MGFQLTERMILQPETSYNDLSDIELSEEITYQFEDKGGIIVFSVNVNAVQLSSNKLINLVKK